MTHFTDLEDLLAALLNGETHDPDTISRISFFYDDGTDPNGPGHPGFFVELDGPHINGLTGWCLDDADDLTGENLRTALEEGLDDRQKEVR
ncbi:hypothetical protein [Streptomonospora litoralis]|uniref:Uncharacterized protein n=1 Tax=Streptomonospora litoralis TaxID=2498135 RepID=A0A4P6Q077_9ACTN|nr:hypothetical protein [Streptomonospora litoralis]QBI53460.1 hypothetical protein EKD16_08330 [Streptomonospora litoralis]